MKRFLIFVLAALCLISFSACTDTEGESEDEKVEDDTHEIELTESDVIEIVCEKLNIEYASTKHFQKFQYDNYYTTLHMLKNTLLCVYKYIEISEKHIDNSYKSC